MATYNFFYIVSGSNDVLQKEYNSSYNINTVKPYFLEETPNVTKVERIDILADPDGINTDEALGYNQGMLPMLNAIAPLAKILFNTIEKSVPDKDLQAKLKADLQTQLLQSNTAELTAAARIVEAEAKAGWFASSWRPLLMYVLIFILIWNYVLGPVILFFFKASITITLPGDVWTLLQIGLGGYVVGRSAESVARTMANKPQPKEQENGQ